MKHFLFIPIILSIIGAGCMEKPPSAAPIIGHADPIIADEEAAKLNDEPIKVKMMAMPCIQFQHNEGFLKWVEAYGSGENEQALLMAERAGLPKEADRRLLEALVTSHPEGATFTNLCVIHKQAQMVSWAVEFSSSTAIYAYSNGIDSGISVASQALEKDPYCQPRTVTNTKLQWICKDSKQKNWQQVHVQRKTGRIDVIDCIAEKDGKQVQPGIDCEEQLK